MPEAEAVICDYVDSLMSTYNPKSASDIWSKPNEHTCKRTYCDIDEQNWDEDYVNLLNMVQRHTNCSSMYCLRLGENGSQKCRFSQGLMRLTYTEILSGTFL